VAVDPKIDELLARLANVKSLPAPSQPFRTAEAAAGSQVRDAAGQAFASTPRLGDAIKGIQQGGVAQTGVKGTLARALGSPLGKVALGGLNVIDMPRRAVITGLKEANDFLDEDPNTKASFKDLRTQFNDQTFGFGRVMPMEGWKGRIVGLIGDIALDPLTYVTLGGTVPAKAIARGAGAAGLRATAKVGAQDVALRAALGTKNITGREGRFALANLVRQYGGNADEVARVAARGKSAVPDDIAKVMGLQRNGLYMFGSRVRLPGSGIIGGALETGLVKSRLGLTNTNVGKKLQYWYTPKGASGTFGDLKNVRADLASGRLPADKVDLVFAQLRGAENGRARGASYGQQYLRDASQVAKLETVQSFDDQIHRFIETADPSLLSPDQRAAVGAVQDHFERVRILLETEGQRLDPGFRLDIGMADPVTGRPRYIPHIQTPEMYRWRQKNPTNPWVALLDAQTSVDVLDMNNNLASRFFKKGKKFLETEDIVQTGSIDELNALWRKHSGTDFDMFETSTQRILAGYEQTVRGAIESFTLLDELKNSDFIRLMRTQGEIDPDYLKALEKVAADRTKEIANLTASARSAADELVNVVRETFNTDYRRSIARGVQRRAESVRAEVRAGESAVADAAAASSRADALSNQLTALVAKQQSEAVSLAAMFEEKNAVMSFMNDALLRSYDEAMDLEREVSKVRQIIADRTVSAEKAEEALAVMEEKAKDAARAFKRAEDTLDYYRLYGDELGPALQSIYERIRRATDTTDGVNLDEPEVYRMLESDLEENLFSGDERVNSILNILMRPFDNTPYQNSKDLGQKWLSDSINSIGETGKLLRSIPDMGAPKGSRATRAQMAKAGKGGRRLTGAQVNDIIGRASTIGDNHEEMADAFFFMTARELRAAYDSAFVRGGEAAANGAQEALAKELFEGTSERAKMWREARSAVKYVKDQMDALREIGSKRQQKGGKYLDNTETIKQIAELQKSIDELEYLSANITLDRYNRAAGILDSFSSGGNKTAFEVLDSFQAVLEDVKFARPELANHSELLKLEGLIADAKQGIFEGKTPTKEGLGSLWRSGESDEFGKISIHDFIRQEFTDSDKLRALTRKKAELERNASEAMSLDKNFTEVSADVLESTKDAGVKLANYHILHATRLAVDAIAALTPSNTAPSEALFAFARSGAARQQLKHLTDFENTIAIADEVIEKIRTLVFGGTLYAGETRETATSIADRALVLRQAVQNLSEEERDALYSVVGDLSYVEKQVATGTKIEVARRTTPEYVSVRDRIWAITMGEDDWRRQIEVEAVPYYSRVSGRAKTYSGTDADLGFASPEDFSPNAAQEQQFTEAQKNARNRINRMENASPKALEKEINRLLSTGKITFAEREDLRFALRDAEEAAVRTQAAARERAGATGKGERAARQRARGVLRSADETFGMSRAFWFATRLRDDGSTLSNQRIVDFFTMLTGDGNVRVSNSGGFKRPQRVLSGEEELFAKETREKIFGNRKDFESGKATKRITGYRETRTGYEDLDYWGKLDEEGFVDFRVSSRIVSEIGKTKSEIRLLKSDYAAKVNANKYADGAKSSLARAEAKLQGLIKQLDELERDAGQLVTRGTDSPESTFKYIPINESALGKARSRTQLRIAALRTLARDPEAGGDFGLSTALSGERAPLARNADTLAGTVSTGRGVERNEILSGSFGLVEFLRGRQKELRGAIDNVERIKARKGEIDKALESVSDAGKQSLADAEAIATNPILRKRVNAAIDAASDDEAVRNKATKDLMRSKQWSSKEPEGSLSPRATKIVNEQRKTIRELLEIQKTADYTAAVEREFRHKLIMLFSNLDLSDPKIQFPQNIFDESTQRSLKGFAKRGAGVRDGLDDSSLMVFQMNEVPLEQIGNEVLNGKASKYVFTVNTQRVQESIVRDVLLKKNRSKFRYTIEAVDDGSDVKRIVYVDKSNNVKHSFNERLADPNAVGREIVLDDPIYVSKVSTQVQSREGGTFTQADRLTEQYFSILDGNLSVFKKNNRVSPGTDVDSFFDPTSTYALYNSPTGERVYRMDAIVGPGERGGLNPLDPSNVFDQSQGRGIVSGFNSLFEEPATPTSKRGRALRAQLATKQAERDKVAAQHAKQLDAVRSSRTAKDRNSAQARVINLSEKLSVIDSELNALNVQIKNSNPVTQMVTVEAVVEVAKYFRENPQLLRRLGVNVQGDVVSDGDVLKGIEKYVDALRYQKLNSTKKKARKSSAAGSVIGSTDGRSYGTLEYVDRVVTDASGKQKKIRVLNTDPESNPNPVISLSTSEVRRRRRVLNKIFAESPEGKLIAEVSAKNRKLAANRKQLIAIQEGGEEASLLSASRATDEELLRAEKQLNLNEKNVAKALRKEKAEPLPGESLADAAERVAREKEQALAAEPLRAFSESVTDDAKRAALLEAKSAEGVDSWYQGAKSGVVDSLKAIRADISARESIIKTLRSRETEVLDRIAVISKMLEGETIPAGQRQAMTDELRSLHVQIHGVPRSGNRPAEKGLNQQISDAVKAIGETQKQRRSIEAQLVQERSAVDTGFYLQLNLNDARKRLDLLNASLEDIRGIRSRARVGKKDGWMEDFDQFSNEVSDMLNRLNAMEDGPDTRRLASVLTGYLEAKANLLRVTAIDRAAADMDIMIRSGRVFSEGDHVIFKQVMDEGWEKLTGSGALSTFSNLQMRPEVAEILTNMGRLRDPVFVKSMRSWFGPYTRFFKAWALATPGYHVRNSLTNAFMLVAAGGRPQFLAEGMREYNALYKALKSGTSIDTYLSRLPDSRRAIVGDSYRAMLGSGVGQSEEIAFDTASVLTNNTLTRASRKVGSWVEQHSRFMLAYDGIRQGFDVNGATARTRKFLFDYEDVSNMDAVMRSIIPFWMWTSRNLPLTIQNIYMNPRPYQWYQSVRRNIEDQEKTEGLPLYMREAGGFALAGTDFAATPDLGFNRLQADVGMLTDPTRFAANVNPLLRVPVETMVAGKSFFRNRDFQESPIPVEGPVGTLASLLGQPIGAGSSVGGQRFVDEKLLYALSNMIPTLNQAERFIPSQEYYKQRGSTNPLLGYVGAPVRQVTPQMRASEQRRILAELQKLMAAQPKVEQ